jgi:hypothetical protein
VVIPASGSDDEEGWLRGFRNRAARRQLPSSPAPGELLPAFGPARLEQAATCPLSRGGYADVGITSFMPIGALCRVGVLGVRFSPAWRRLGG